MIFIYITRGLIYRIMIQSIVISRFNGHSPRAEKVIILIEIYLAQKLISEAYTFTLTASSLL
jgi:hypothetical protein